MHHKRKYAQMCSEVISVSLETRSFCTIFNSNVRCYIPCEFDCDAAINLNNYSGRAPYYSGIIPDSF